MANVKIVADVPDRLFLAKTCVVRFHVTGLRSHPELLVFSQEVSVPDLVVPVRSQDIAERVDEARIALRTELQDLLFELDQGQIEVVRLP